jgi:predicted AAA+ superfamily ATPase
MKYNEIYEQIKDKDVSQEVLDLLGIKKDVVWKPEVHKDYWLVTPQGVIVEHNNNSMWDEQTIDNYNAYKSEEDAELRAKQIRFGNAIHSWICHNDRDALELDFTDINTNKYYIYYNHYNKRFSISCNFKEQDGHRIYFSTQDKAQQCLKDMSEEFDLFYKGE